MDDDEIVISATEIIKARLYFATLKDGYKPKTTKNSKYFHIEDEIVYENFYFDFGPYHLCHLYQFCRRLNLELARSPKKKVVFYTSNSDMLRLNAAYLIGSYQIIYLNKSPGWVYSQLTGSGEWSLLTFRDASGGPALFHINLLDVFQGLKVAMDANFFDFDDFNEEEYLFYETVENGDLNWIVPGKMLAFSGPHARSRLDRGYPLHSPEHYHQYFRRHNVTTIVRLNKKSYEAAQFTAHGFQHKELFFVDGSVPSEAIVDRFLRIAEAAPGALAVHCKAGLGRTGTLIACYMMKHYGFMAREAIAWLRLCRPGSVIGHQQWFLENVETRMHAEGAAWRRRHGASTLAVCPHGVYSLRALEPRDDVDNATDAERTRDKPVSLTTILNNNCATRRNVKLDNANELNANDVCDTENNLSTKLRTTPSAPTAAPAAPRLRHYMLPTNSIHNASNTNLNLKPQPRTLNSTLKMHYSSKTSTFPPTRGPPGGKLTSNLKSQFTGKNSFHGQRANLARPNLPFTHGSSPFKGFSRKTTAAQSRFQESPVVTTLTTVTSTLTTMTENCHLNGKNRLQPEPKTTPTRAVASNINVRKKPIVRSNSNSRKKLQKNVPAKTALDNSNQDLSSSDTNTTNFSTDSLEVPVRFRRKRDKSNSPEPMDCASNSVITSDVTPENIEETLNSQGNKLYKIKALRKKCPAFGAGILGKKDGVQTRSSSLGTHAAVKKK